MRSTPVSPSAQRAADPDSSRNTSQQRNRSSLRSDTHWSASFTPEAKSRQMMASNDAAASSSDSALPPGAPKGSRINSVTYRVSCTPSPV